MKISRQKFHSIAKNEVTWGCFIIGCCAVSLLIIWTVNRPVEWQKYKDPVHEKSLLALIGGIFALTSTFMSFIQILQHFIHKTHHQSQKRIMRILAMVPLYALTSWISILFSISAIYMEFIKSCFEAYIIYSFLLLLTKYLGGHRGVEQVIIAQQTIHLPFPFCCLKPRPHLKWVWYFKFALLQYTWINPLCSAIAVVLNLADVYGNGHWNFQRGFPYIIFIINISQTIALYSLVAFYENTKEPLKPFSPLPKFIVIKLIVFFIFWQTVLMSGLAAANILRNTSCDPTTNELCNGSTTGSQSKKKKFFSKIFSFVLKCSFFPLHIIGYSVGNRMQMDHLKNSLKHVIEQ